ncbi:MAG: response regulator, partial [Planctomycetota bacterium JB042]
LPKVDGRDVLATVKTDQALRSIPVVVLSGSDAEHDVDACYDLGANCYVTKPVGFSSHRDLVRAIEQFWLEVVKLPGEAGADP